LKNKSPENTQQGWWWGESKAWGRWSSAFRRAFLFALGVLWASVFLASGLADEPVAQQLGQDVWFDAVAENHYTTVKGMLDAGYDVQTTQRVTELTALHFAAGGGAGETLVLLLCNSANVDARDTVQMTPLHHACELGQAKIAEVLLAHGADVNAVGGVHGPALGGATRS